MSEVFDPFARHRVPEGQPKPEANTVNSDQKLQAAQKLLNWLLRWPKETVSAREIRQFGPSATRDPQDAMNSAEILTRHGWLSPMQSKRRDRREWRVIRRPTIFPTVAP
jgi:hypothetical protein